MISVRLNDELARKLKRAARSQAITHSEFLRSALSRRCDEVLGKSLKQRLAAVIGIVNSSGGRAVRSDAAFRATLARRRGG